jgi:hypothetical protein
VTLRAGTEMSSLIRVAHDPNAAAPAVVHGDTVTVRRRRGVGHGELELDPRYRWQVKIHAPTWNTVLDATGLDLAAVTIDGGATRVKCVLPPPRGVVPTIFGGAVNVRLRRPHGVTVIAEIGAGAVRVRLDDFSVAAAVGDHHWNSRIPPADDHYLLRISGGAARVSLEQDPSIEPAAADRPIPPASPAVATAALRLVLDGVAARRRDPSDPSPIRS